MPTEMTDGKPKTKALVVATRCQTVEQFVATFHRFCDDTTFFVATLASRPVGLETAFSIQLEDKTPVLRGLCTVAEAWATPANRFGRPGVRLSVKRLTNESLVVFKQLQAARKAFEAAEAAKPPEPVKPPEPEPPVVIAESSKPRTDGTLVGVTSKTPITPASGVPLAKVAIARVATPPRGVTPPAKPEPAASEPASRATPPKLPPLRPIPRATPPAIAVVIPPITTETTVVDPPAPPSPPPKPRLPSEPPIRPDLLADVPEPIPASDDMTNPVAVESRTPGSSFVLPANPLMNLTDQSLEGFIDCALYEETGGFSRAPDYEDSLVDIDDVIAPPPPGRGAPQTLTPVNVLRPNAFVPQYHDEEFVPEHTPLPVIAGIQPMVPRRAATPLPMPPTPPAGRAPTPPVFDEHAEMFPRAHAETGPPLRSPPTAPPLNAPMAEPPPMAMQPLGVAPPSFETTDSLLAINRKRDKQRWMIIGGVAAGVSLLLLIVVIAKSGGGSSNAATPPPDPPATAPTKAAVVETPAKPRPPETPPATPPDPVADPAQPDDPNAPPVVGTGPCRVTVTSSPAGSVVHLDDQSFGPSPITIDGPCAKRRVGVKHPRYALGTKWVTLVPGKPATVDLALARPTHNVMVTSMPPGATVSIAGRRAGTTPTAVKVMGFTGVTLTIEKKGFKTVSQKLYSKVDNDKVAVKLVRGK